jgi:uncharacterized protein YjbI with pentapeptide repeats
VANEEHVKRLKQGVAEWNAWRDEAAPRALDFCGANLSGANLREVNLSGTNLSGANLRRANLTRANLRHSILSDANLTDAYLDGANLGGAYVTKAQLGGSLLNDANLTSAHLTGANLDSVNLCDAKLDATNLTGANLCKANLSRANLSVTILTSAYLISADLSHANLSHANLTRADLSGANLFQTIFGNVDLTSAIGLETCRHRGPSIIDYQSLQKSKPLPLAFLRGVGLPDQFIEYLPSLLNQAIQFYSCFISHSSKDQEFADRVYADLQNKGVRCWFAPHDMKIGGKILDTIDEAIRLRDKVLLILSEHSIKSDWVEDEVSKAFEEERKRDQIVLFPLRIDDAVMDTSEAWAAKLRAQRNIGDFRRWKDHDGYKKSFERVLRDLKRAAESER